MCLHCRSVVGAHVVCEALRLTAVRSVRRLTYIPTLTALACVTDLGQARTAGTAKAPSPRPFSPPPPPTPLLAPAPLPPALGPTSATAPSLPSPTCFYFIFYFRRRLLRPNYCLPFLRCILYSGDVRAQLLPSSLAGQEHPKRKWGERVTERKEKKKSNAAIWKTGSVVRRLQCWPSFDRSSYYRRAAILHALCYYLHAAQRATDNKYSWCQLCGHQVTLCPTPHTIPLPLSFFRFDTDYMTV